MPDHVSADSVFFGDEVVANSVVHLGRSRLFAGAGDEVVARYAECFALRLVVAGTTIAPSERRKDRGVYVIRRGKVRLEQRIAERLTVVTAILGPADVFGLEALFSSGPCTVARCLQETLMLVAPVERLRSSLELAEISRNVAGIFASSLNETAKAFENLQYLRLAEAALVALEDIALQHGIAVAEGTVLDVCLKPNDVAAIVRCGDVGDVSRALNLLEAAGRIRTNGTSITLLNFRESMGKA